MPRFPKQTYTVYLRIGNDPAVGFRWTLGATFEGPKDAVATVKSHREAGTVAYYAPTHLLEAIGLPETFDGDEEFNR